MNDRTRCIKISSIQIDMMKVVMFLALIVLAVGLAYADIDSDLILYYSGDNIDTTGTTAIDRTGNYNGTMNGGITGNQSLKIGEAYYMDGIDDYIQSSLPAYLINGTLPFTICLWINISSIQYSEGDGIFGNLDGSNAGIMLNMDHTPSETFAYWINGFSIINQEIFVSTPYYVCLVWNLNRFQAYIDGVNQTFGDGGSYEGINLSTTQLQFGNGYSYAVEPIDAYFDEMAVWGSVLTAADIEFLYNDGEGTYFNGTEFIQSCIPNWTCSDYSDICGFDNLLRCEAVTDTDSCGDTYTGNYSEFTPQSCVFCADTLFLNETFDDPDYTARGWINESISGGNIEITGGYFHDAVDSGSARLYRNMTLWNMSAGWHISENVQRSSSSSAYLAETRLGYTIGNFEMFYLANTGNFTFLGNGNTCSGNLTSFLETYVAPLDSDTHKIDYIMDVYGDMQIYFDDQYIATYSYDPTSCDLMDKFRIASRFTDMKLMDVAICGIENEFCVPNYTCAGIGSCLSDDSAPCNETTDLNSCGIPYSGNFSEFGLFVCDYCAVAGTSGATACVMGSLTEWYAATNYYSCCNVTNFTTDCLVSGYDTRLGTNGNYSFSAACAVPGTATGVSVDLSLLIVTLLLIAMFALGLIFMNLMLLLVSGLGFIIVGASPLITLMPIRVVFIGVGIVATYIFTMIAIARD